MKRSRDITDDFVRVEELIRSRLYDDNDGAIASLEKCLKDRRDVMSLEALFDDAFIDDETSDTAFDAAMQLFDKSIDNNVRIDAALFPKLAYVVYRNGFTYVADERTPKLKRGLQLAFEPSKILQEYGAYVVATAKAYGITRMYDHGSSGMDEYLYEDGTILNMESAITSTFNVFFGTYPEESHYNTKTRVLYPVAMMLYTGMIVWDIMLSQMDPDNGHAIYEHARDKVKSFLACLGIVPSYVCIGGEEEVPVTPTDDTLFNIITSYYAVEHDKGRYFAFRHAAARFLRARLAARTVQRAWRARKLRIQNAVRSLHIINKFKGDHAELPRELVRAIARKI